MTRKLIEAKVSAGDYDSEYAEFIIDNCDGDRVICSGDTLIEAMEALYLFDEFVDFLENWEPCEECEEDDKLFDRGVAAGAEQVDKLKLLLLECDAVLGMLSTMPPVLVLRDKIADVLKPNVRG